MILREVRLENVKSYGTPAEIISFTRGVNAICGPNGAGKSTILEAIGCALFQHLPYKHEEFVREGEATGTITLVIESRLDSRTYEVVRRVGRGGTHYVHDPDIQQQIARGEAEVRTWLHQHLKIDPSVDLRALFVDAVGPPQGTLTAVFLDAPQERRSKFNRLLRVDEYEDAFRRLAAIDSTLDKERAELDREIARLDGQTEGRDAVELRLGAVRDERADQAVALSRALAQREVVEALLRDFDRRKQAWDLARIASDGAAAEERHAKARFADAARAFETARLAAEICERTRPAFFENRELEAALGELDKRRRERDRLLQRRADLVSRFTRTQSETKGIDAEISRLERGLDEAQRLEERIPEQEAAERRLQDARMALQSVERLKSGLKTAQQDLERIGERGKRLQAEINRIADGRLIAEELSPRKLRYDELAAGLAAANRADGLLQQLRQSLQREQRQIADLRSKIEDLDRRIAAASLTPVPEETLGALELRLRQAGEARASARTQLVHARQTRIQVAGGLCPFLHEECRNLRPGVDLAHHFDGEIARWNAEVERLERTFVSMEESTQRAKATEEQRQKVVQWSQQRAELTATYEDSSRQLAEIADKVRDAAALASSRSELERAVKAAQDAWQASERAARDLSRLPALETEIQEARGEWATVKAQIEADGIKLRELANADDEVRAAQQALRVLNGPRERASHLRDEARSLPARREEKRATVATLEALQGDLATLDDALAPFAGLDERVEANRRRREEIQPDYLAYLRASDLAATVGEKTAEHASAESAVRATTAARAQADATLTAAAAEYDRAEHDGRIQRRVELDQTIGKVRAGIDTAEAEEIALKARLADLDRLLADKTELTRQVEAIDEEKQVASALRAAIRAAGPEITQRLLVQISRTASAINGEVLNQAGIEIVWTPEFEIVTRRQGTSRDFSQLSGGEQMAAALAVRLALLRELSNGRMAFLDEPTAHLDQERRSNLGEQVQRLQGFDQLIVISHDDTFDGLFGHVIRIGREAGRSRVIKDS